MTRKERDLAAAEELCLRVSDLLCRVINLAGDIKSDEDSTALNDACRTLDKVRAKIGRELAKNLS